MRTGSLGSDTACALSFINHLHTGRVKVEDYTLLCQIAMSEASVGTFRHVERFADRYSSHVGQSKS